MRCELTTLSFYDVPQFSILRNFTRVAKILFRVRKCGGWVQAMAYNVEHCKCPPSHAHSVPRPTLLMFADLWTRCRCCTTVISISRITCRRTKKLCINTVTTGRHPPPPPTLSTPLPAAATVGDATTATVDLVTSWPPEDGRSCSLEDTVRAVAAEVAAHAATNPDTPALHRATAAPRTRKHPCRLRYEAHTEPETTRSSWRGTWQML
jgi:hypothetical protein